MQSVVVVVVVVDRGQSKRTWDRLEEEEKTGIFGAPFRLALLLLRARTTKREKNCCCTVCVQSGLSGYQWQAVPSNQLARSSLLFCLPSSLLRCLCSLINPLTWALFPFFSLSLSFTHTACNLISLSEVFCTTCRVFLLVQWRLTEFIFFAVLPLLDN